MARQLRFCRNFFIHRFRFIHAAPPARSQNIASIMDSLATLG
jgi:hypothetical protein